MDFVSPFAADHRPSVFEPVAGGIVYLIVICLLKTTCTVRRDLTAFTVVHNVILICLSVVMAIGSALALYGRYSAEGFDGIFCSQRHLLHGREGTVLDGAPGLWIRIFYYSKFLELIDTALLCFKLKPTIPLHIYHHVIMLFLCWSWVRFDWLEGSLWCVIVNSIIHTFMYTYYLLAALGQNVWWKRYLTSGQIFQFLTGMVYVSVYMFNDYTRAQGWKGGCGAIERRYTAWAAHSVNITFVLLFAQFYRLSYKAKTG